jgi:hypothetical protein
VLFDMLEALPLDNAQDPANKEPDAINAIKEPDANTAINDGAAHRDDLDVEHAEHPNQRLIPPIPGEPCRSSRTAQPSCSGQQSSEYKEREAVGKEDGLDWATNSKLTTALSVTDWANP